MPRLPSATPPTANATFVALKVRHVWMLRAGNCVGRSQKSQSQNIASTNALFHSIAQVRLQTTWREIAPLETVALGNEVAAQIKGLDPKQRHLVRVTAIGPSGAPLWESPVVALTPPPARCDSARLGSCY